MKSHSDLKKVRIRTDADPKEIAKRSELALHGCFIILNWIWMVPEWLGMDLDKLCMSSGWGLQEVE